jgi:hypothetical protein
VYLAGRCARGSVRLAGYRVDVRQQRQHPKRTARGVRLLADSAPVALFS